MSPLYNLKLGESIQQDLISFTELLNVISRQVHLSRAISYCVDIVMNRRGDIAQ